MFSNAMSVSGRATLRQRSTSRISPANGFSTRILMGPPAQGGGIVGQEPAKSNILHIAFRLAPGDHSGANVRHVVSAALPELRNPLRLRVHVRRRAAHPSCRRRAGRGMGPVRLLEGEHDRRGARVVVPPAGLPSLVRRGAQRHDQRGARLLFLRAQQGEIGRRARMTRLGPGGAESIDRSRSITFEFNERTVAAHPGDTIGSALAASGRAILSRSFKYHRPRGLLCVSGKCPNCMMQVDGVPNVRSCVEPVRAGMKVRTQKGWPSLSWDWMAVLQWFDALLPVGFYYRTFTR